jgi:hypothetical protein
MHDEIEALFFKKLASESSYKTIFLLYEIHWCVLQRLRVGRQIGSIHRDWNTISSPVAASASGLPSLHVFLSRPQEPLLARAAHSLTLKSRPKNFSGY